MASTNPTVNTLFKISKYDHMIQTSQTVLPNKFSFLTLRNTYLCIIVHFTYDLLLDPASPNKPSFLSSTSTSITLLLNPANEGPVRRTFTVELSQASYSNRIVATTRTNQTLVTVTNLHESTQYNVQVYASNRAGISTPSSSIYYWTGLLALH